MTIYEIFESIAAIGSTNAKLKIIQDNADNAVLKNVFYYAYNPRFNYWIKSKSLPEVKGTHDINSATFVVLDALINREITGDAARAHVNLFMETLTAEAQEIMSRIINHDLRCGASDTLAAKVWKGIVPEYPVLLCDKFNAKTEKHLKQYENNVGFWVELKEDGGRLIVEVDSEGVVKYRSRNGNELNLFGLFDAQLSKHTNMVFDGELVIIQKDGKPNRKLGNGFYTKAVRGTLTEDEAKQFTYKLWDCVPAVEYSSAGKVPYSERRKFIEQCEFTDNIGQVYGEYLSTLAECAEFYGRMRADGQEGCIIKVANAIWEDRRSKNYIKMKAENTGDFKCIGTEEGTGKYKGMIGALVCESSCGQVKFSVGTGLKDDDRAKDPSEYIDSIIEVKYNELITSKGRTTKSLFLPVYAQIRKDKNVANSLEELE